MHLKISAIGIRISWTEHTINEYMAEQLGITSGTLLNFIMKHTLSYFGHKWKSNIREINTRRKRGRHKEDQRDLGRRMWRTGWGLVVSGEWDKQQNIDI